MCTHPLRYMESDTELGMLVFFIGSQKKKIQQKSLLIVKWKVSPAKHYNCFREVIHFFFRPLFHDLKYKYKDPTLVRWYSRLQRPNCFAYEQYVSRCFSGEMVPWREKKKKKSSEGELVCQSEPLSSRPPLHVIFSQTWRETELLGHSDEYARKWASAQNWHHLWFAYAEWG